MVMDHYGHFLSAFRGALLTALTPIEQAATLPAQVYHWAHQDFSDLNQLKKEINQLKTENLLLRSNQLQLNKLQQDVVNLNALLGTASQIALTRTPIIATVEYYSSSPYAQFYKVNKGYLDDIRQDQAVIDANGVVGQVTSVTPTNSRVQLITNPDNQVPVRIQRTGQRGILAGIGNNRLSLNFIPNASSIQVGDILETSGLGGLYPAGYPVARVTEYSKQADQPYYHIEATPVAQLQKTDKVLILALPNQEISDDE